MKWLNNLICCIATIIFIGCNYTSTSNVNIKQNEIDSSRYFEGYETGDFYITPELTKEGLKNMKEVEMASMEITNSNYEMIGEIEGIYEISNVINDNSVNVQQLLNNMVEAMKECLEKVKQVSDKSDENNAGTSTLVGIVDNINGMLKELNVVINA